MIILSRSVSNTTSVQYYVCAIAYSTYLLYEMFYYWLFCFNVTLYRPYYLIFL